MEKELLNNKPKARVWSVLTTNCIVNLASPTISFALAYPSPIAINILKTGLLNTNTFPIFTSIYLYTSILGPLIVYALMYNCGRKTLILLSAIPSAIGWILIITGTSASWLILGRAIGGISCGMIWVLVPVYVGEISQAKNRGFFSTLFSLSLSLGLIACCGAGIFLPYKWLAIIPLGTLIIMSVGLIFLPYSPVWLTQRGYKDTALNTLEYLRGKSYNIDAEYAMIVNALASTRSVTVREKIAYLRKPHAIRVFMVSCGIATLYHFSGISLISCYGTLFLENITILTPNIAFFFTMLFEIVGSCISVALIDRVGRKYLLCLSFAIFIFCNICFSSYFYLITYVYPLCAGANFANQTNAAHSSGGTYHICSYLSIIPILSIIFSNVSFSAGLGPIYFTYVGELFPIKLKSFGANLTTLINRMVGGTIILLFPYYAKYVGLYLAFLTLAIILFISIPIVILFVPETKCKTIKELEELFKYKCIHVC